MKRKLVYYLSQPPSPLNVISPSLQAESDEHLKAMSHLAGVRRKQIVHVLSNKLRNAKWIIQLDQVHYNGIELPSEFAQQRKRRFLSFCKDFRKLSIQARNMNYLELWSNCLMEAAGDVEELEIIYPRDNAHYAAYSILNLDNFDFPELTTLRIIG